MLNIKKQIRTLYIAQVLGNLSITGAWVAILAFRGFSLVQIGIAETIFHITSLIFEIPSGALADIFGRKRTLIISNVMSTIGCVIMAFTNGFAGVCISFVFLALSYNFASGSGDALAYDSLKSVHMEDKYEGYSSNQTIIYRIGTGISTLCAGVALAIGYRPAYIISVINHLITIAVLLRLKEVRCVADEALPTLNAAAAGDNHAENVADETSQPLGIKTATVRKVSEYFTESFRFMGKNVKATLLMFANSFVGAVDILLLFFLQSKLMEAGISNRGLGVALFVMEMGGIIGARLILKAKKARYYAVFTVCTLGVLCGVILEHSGIALIMTAGGFISAIADDALQVRTDARLQDNPFMAEGNTYIYRFVHILGYNDYYVAACRIFLFLVVRKVGRI